MQPAVAGIVAVRGVAGRVAVFDRAVRPVVEGAVNFDISQPLQLGNGAHTLVAPDVLRHLHVVIVGVPALHRVDAAVELGVVLVDESVVAFAPHERVGFAFLGVVLAGGPLVPVVDVEELGIGGEGLVPPRLEIDAVAFRVLDGLAEPGHVCGHGQVIFVQFRLFVFAGPALADH